VAKVAAAKILVIDDNAAVVDVLVACLHQEGYKVSGALTGEEGLKVAYVDKPFDFAYLKRVVAMAFQTEPVQPNEHSTG